MYITQQKQIKKCLSARNKCEAAVIRRRRKQLSTLTGFEGASCFRICKLTVEELSWQLKVCFSKANFELATEFSPTLILLLARLSSRSAENPFDLWHCSEMG